MTTTITRRRGVLSPGQARALLAIRMLDGEWQRCKAIAEALGVTATNAGHHLRCLEQLGVVEAKLVTGGFLEWREVRP